MLSWIDWILVWFKISFECLKNFSIIGLTLYNLSNPDCSFLDSLELSLSKDDATIKTQSDYQSSN